MSQPRMSKTRSLSQRFRSSALMQSAPTFDLQVPIFDKLALHIETSGIEEGLFRVPGSRKEIEELLMKTATPNEFLELDLSTFDIHSVDGAMKQYLRDNPTRIIHASRLQLLHEAVFIDPEKLVARPVSEFILVLMTVCQQLPKSHAHILWRLLILLDKVQKQSEITKMHAENLGVVFGPTICDASTSSSHHEVLKCNQMAADIITLFIQRAPILCQSLQMFQSPETFRSFGKPPPLSMKELNLFNFQSTGKNIEKEEFLDESKDQIVYRLTGGSLRVSLEGQNVSFLLDPPTFFGWGYFLCKRIPEHLRIQSVALTSCQIFDIRKIHQVFEFDSLSFMHFYWRIAEFYAYSLRFFTTTASINDTNDLIDLETKLKQRTKQQVRSIDVQVNYEGEIHLLSCESDKSVEDLLYIAIESFPSTKGKPLQNFELSLPLGASTMYELSRSDPIGAFAGQTKQSLTTVFLVPNAPTDSTSVLSALDCKYKEKKGLITLSTLTIEFRYKSFGRVKKHKINIDDIHSAKLHTRTILVICKTATPSTFVFTEKIAAQEYYEVLDNILKQNSKTNESKKNSESETLGEEDVPNVRAEVNSQFETKLGGISLQEGDIVLITKILLDESAEQGMYFGYSSTASGWFPKSKVKIFDEVPLVNRIVEKGYDIQLILPTPADWDLITKKSVSLSFSPGDIIRSTFDFGNHFYYVEEGSCVTESGRLWEKHEMFGVEEFILGGAPPESIIARTDMIVFQFDPTTLSKLFKTFPSVAGRFFGLLCIILDSQMPKPPKEAIQDK